MGLALPAHSLANSCPASHYDETARVKYVHDGDTLRLQDGRKIRLTGINAPEVARDRRPAEAFSHEARDRLKQLIASSAHQVKLVFGKDRHDRYRRTLAHLFLPDGTNLQAALIADGLATANAYPPNLAFTDCYSEVELNARCESRGIWSTSNYATKNSQSLKPGTRGFNIITGKVERISESDKGVWVFLQGGVMIGIRSDDLPSFERNELKALTSKTVTARGWLNPKTQSKKGVKFYMRVRHPSALAVGNEHISCR